MKFSVIIPVYNTENFLEKCLNSVINQTYDNLEIIIVNDGSTDRSKKIIDNYAKSDLRIIAIHQENGGIGSAYKAAFKTMSGDYISFVDSDDYLELNFYKDMFNIIQSYNPDYIHFGIAFKNKLDAITKYNSTLDCFVNDNEELLNLHFKKLKHPSLVKIFKANLFKNIHILEQNIGIDELLTIQILPKCKSAFFTSKVYYNVLERENSVCRESINEKGIIAYIKVYQLMVVLIDKNTPKYAHYIYNKYLNNLISFFYIISKSNSENQSLNKIIITDIKTIFYKLVSQNKWYNLSRFVIINTLIIIINNKLLKKTLSLKYKFSEK